MKRIIRSKRNRVLAGVCGGFAEYFKLDPALIRSVWIFFTLFGGSGILAYILAIIIIPDEIEVSAEQSAKDSQYNTSRILWLTLLLVVGILLFYQHYDLIQTIWRSFWGSGINVVFSLVLIILGMYLIYTRRTQLASSSDQITLFPLRLSEQDKKVAGVCGGIAETFQIDSTLIRFLWIFGSLMSIGVGIVLYITLAIILPKSSITSKKTI